MARKEQPNAAGPFDVGSIAETLRSAAGAQQRSFNLVQEWFTGLLGSLQEQAENYSRMLRALESSLAAVEKAVDSQAEASKALKNTLEASQQGIASAAAAQERSLELVKSLFGGMLEMSKLQLEVLRGPGGGDSSAAGAALTAQAETFQRMTQEWVDAYTRTLESTMSAFTAGAEKPARTRRRT